MGGCAEQNGWSSATERFSVIGHGRKRPAEVGDHRGAKPVGRRFAVAFVGIPLPAHAAAQGARSDELYLVLTPSLHATDSFIDNEVAFSSRLIRVYELDAAEILHEGSLCLLPLIPLMRGGIELTESADRLIYGSAIPAVEKAEMLTGMAILSGLVSRDLAATLITRRRDLMIESFAYELIKREGIQEGLEEGLTQGLKAGRKQGLEQGRGTGLREGLLDSISFGLGLRFGTPGDELLTEISRLPDTQQLRAVAHALWTVETLEELRAVYRPH